MEKTVFIITLSMWIPVPILAFAVFSQITFGRDLFDSEYLMKRFIQFFSLDMLWISVLFISCLLNYPLIDRLF